MAEHAAIFMYHCGTSPVLHHIGNGMYGRHRDRPANLAPVDHEYFFVQSESTCAKKVNRRPRRDAIEASDAVVFDAYAQPVPAPPIRWSRTSGSAPGCSTRTVGDADRGRGALGVFQAGDVSPAADAAGH